MRLWLSFLVFVVVLGENNKGRGRAESARSRLTKDGDVIIQGLFPLSNSDGGIMRDFVVGAQAMIYAIKRVNERSDILPKIDLGYEIVDDKGETLHEIMNQAIRIVSKYRPQSVCRAEEEFCTKDSEPGPFGKRISALIGPATSSKTVPVASLLGLYNIPQIGYSATSKLLSEKSRFKSFLRPIPSDEYQTKAMVALIKKFGWNYVFFVGSDDEYGREGLASFKTAAREAKKVCTANEVNIAFEGDDSQKEIEDSVRKIDRNTRVGVVVLFMFQSQAAKVIMAAAKQGLRQNITWIMSEAVRENIVGYGVPKDLLHGALVFGFASEEIPEFKTHLENITIKSSKTNPWMTKLLEHSLNCSAATPLASGKRLCKDDERLNLAQTAITDNWSTFVNIINSVTAIANGLDGLLKCKEGQGLLENGRCPNKSLPLNGKDLFLYIKNVTFLGAMNETVAFDEKGDMVSKVYVIRNFVFDRQSNTLKFPKVANWYSELPDELKMQGNVVWSNGTKPKSNCSEECSPGEMTVGQSDCCWACHPCPKGEISNGTGATKCIKCPDDTYANKQRTECIKIGVTFVEASDPFSIVIITISCISLVAMVFVSLLFSAVRDTPLIQDSSPLLLGMFVLSTQLAFAFSIFQVSLYRTDDACRFMGAYLLYIVLLVASTLLAKTQTCDHHLKLFISHYFKAATQYCNLVMILTSLLFELLLIGVWFLTDSPVVHFVEETEAVHLRECNASWSAARFIATGFPLFVLFAATALAFKERDSRKNHKEAKYISFCTISMCILLIAFFPTYRFVRGVTTSVVIATTALVGAYAVVGCIIVPKVYILVFRPDSNVPEHERSHDPTVSSAHTAGGSHPGSSGHHNHNTGSFCAETGEQLRSQNEVESTPSSSNGSSGEADAAKDAHVK